MFCGHGLTEIKSLSKSFDICFDGKTYLAKEQKLFHHTTQPFYIQIYICTYIVNIVAVVIKASNPKINTKFRPDETKFVNTHLHSYRVTVSRFLRFLKVLFFWLRAIRNKTKTIFVAFSFSQT